MPSRSVMSQPSPRLRRLQRTRIVNTLHSALLPRTACGCRSSLDASGAASGTSRASSSPTSPRRWRSSGSAPGANGSPNGSGAAAGSSKRGPAAASLLLRGRSPRWDTVPKPHGSTGKARSRNSEAFHPCHDSRLSIESVSYHNDSIHVSPLCSYVLAAYGRLDNFDAMQLGVLFEALPAISPHPNWLDELIQICATESSPLLMTRSRSSESSYVDEASAVVETGPTSNGHQTARIDLMASPSPNGGEQRRQRSGLWSMANGGAGPVIHLKSSVFDSPPNQQAPETTTNSAASSSIVNN